MQNIGYGHMTRSSENLDQLESKISQLQSDFSKSSNTRLSLPFSKNTQKLNCAQEVLNHFHLGDLLHKMAYIKGESRHIFFDYLIFKTFAHPSIYDTILDHVVALSQFCIQTHGRYNIHINIKSFTVTAAQRYNDLILKFFSICLQKDSIMVKNLDNIYIYNSPKMFESITRIFSNFIDDEIQSKIIHVKETF